MMGETVTISRETYDNLKKRIELLSIELENIREKNHMMEISGLTYTLWGRDGSTLIYQFYGKKKIEKELLKDLEEYARVSKEVRDRGYWGRILRAITDIKR